MENNKLAIYIHWPFCKSKCPYCDFNSHVREAINIEDWNKAYINDIEKNKEYLSNKEVVSIFFGGGTPSLMPPMIVENIITNLSNFSKLADDIEVTLEANPTSVEANKFKNFAKAGVNRVSLGVQSMNEEDLKFLGREHNVDEAIRAINLAKENFKSYSFDLIYALPNQTLMAWEKELNKALELTDKHLSLYQLTIEKGTKFFSMYRDKKFSLPNENLASEFYHLTQEIMDAHNMPAYEISNHAYLGEECKHNLVYWNYGDFLGIGPGAHSRINNQALTSIYNPENWLNKVLSGEEPYQDKAQLSEEEVLSEFMLMGLRLKEGIEEKRLFHKTQKKFKDLNLKKLQLLSDEGFISFTDGKLKATKKGTLVLNEIINQLVEV